MPEGTYLDSALYLSSLDSARFSWAGREYLGKVALDGDRADMLAALELEPEAYGCALYDAVFPAGSELREGLREAVVAAEQEKSRLRFLLHIAPDLPDWVHGLYWELLTDNDRHLALARSPDTAFSRYLGVRRAPGTPATRRPRLLCVIAAPSNLEKFNMAEICRDEVVQRLRAPFGMLAESVDVAILEPPATLGRLRERLMADGGFHLLHFFGHGQNRGGVSALVMEDDQGRAQFVGEELLAEVFLGVRELRLVTLIACHGGAPSSRDPFSGLAGRLVQRGLPAVIAMRREVSVEDGHLFTNHLYGHLVQTGRADAAVNEARQQLYLANPRGIAWSSPVLYSRLTDGRLWLPQEEEAGEAGTAETSPLFQVSWRRLLHPLPWLPAVLALALLVLGVWPAANAEMRLDLRVSRISFQLARNATVVERLRLREIAATQLEALRLPALPAPAATAEGRPAGSGQMKGFFLAVRPHAEPATQLTFNALPLLAGSRMALEHLGTDGDDAPNAYRLSFDGSDEELRVTIQGDVVLKPLDAPPEILHLAEPDSLVLYPRSRSLDLDVLFDRFAGDEISREIPIDRLALLRIVEQHGAEHSTVREESTVLEGEVRARATGERHRLKKGELLRFAGIAGSLTGLRLGDDGIRFIFQGRISKLERVPVSLQPENLMPSILDLWITGPAARAVQAAAGVLALLVLFLTVSNRRPHRKEIQ
jgi:hypothetical protein